MSLNDTKKKGLLAALGEEGSLQELEKKFYYPSKYQTMSYNEAVKSYYVDSGASEEGSLNDVILAGTKTILDTAAVSYGDSFQEAQTAMWDGVSNSTFNPTSGNMLSNGDFSKGTDDWSNSNLTTFEIEDGRAHLVGEDGVYARLYQNVDAEVGATYQISSDIDLVAGSFSWLIVRDDGTQDVLGYDTTTTGTINVSDTHVATTDSLRVELQLHNTGSPPEAYFDNVVVKRIYGV